MGPSFGAREEGVRLVSGRDAGPQKEGVQNIAEITAHTVLKLRLVIIIGDRPNADASAYGYPRFIGSPFTSGARLCRQQDFAKEVAQRRADQLAAESLAIRT
jgi:hypothetical protein